MNVQSHSFFFLRCKCQVYKQNLKKVYGYVVEHIQLIYLLTKSKNQDEK